MPIGGHDWLPIDMFRGVMPFLLAMILGLLLIIAFPSIATFIPDTMFG